MGIYDPAVYFSASRCEPFGKSEVVECVEDEITLKSCHFIRICYLFFAMISGRSIV